MHWQDHARRALDFLWEKRQRHSNLVGTTINIHSGEWVRRGESPWSLKTSVHLDQRLDGLKENHWPMISMSGSRNLLKDLFCLLADSGVGAGIDSYYEYLLKAYILLGDDLFLQRFNIVRTHTCTHPIEQIDSPPL